MIARWGTAVRHSAALAAVLSFVIPGLGHLLSGAVRRGALLALPVLALVIGGFVLLSSLGTGRSVGLLLQPGVLLGIVALNAILLAYRLGAILDAYSLASLSGPTRGGQATRLASLGLLGVVLATTMGMHAWIGFVGVKTYDTVTTVFAGAPTPSPSPEPTQPPSLGPSVTPLPTPAPTPRVTWDSNGRLDLLLVGGDAGPGRWSLRTDSMILLSVDLETGRAALFGIPRNLINVPLPPESADAFACGCFPEIINGLWVYAAAHPEFFPGDDDRGYRALQGAIGVMTNRPIDGMVVVTLQGFVRLVDALGGIDITVPNNIYDYNYPLPDGSGNIQLYIPKGFQHMDGKMALAYARTRHQDNDYNRMQRQQQVLLAMRRTINPCTLVVRIPELLDIARETFWTNLDITDLPDILALGARVEPSKIANYYFWPPEIPERLNDAALAKIRLMTRSPFDAEPSATPGPSGEPTPLPTPGPIC
jgi:LCP family protein required for cell wall assembly